MPDIDRQSESGNMSAQVIELLVLIAIAAFVLYRLKGVIGTRTGHEGPPPRLGNREAEHRGPMLEPVPDIAPDEPGQPEDNAPIPDDARPALEKIREHEPDFSVDQFLSGARQAYEMILMAYEEGNRDTLSGLLNGDVLAEFENAILQRQEAGLTVDARFIGVRDIRVEGISFDDDTGEADLTVRFVGEMITAVRDAENRVVEGDPNEIRRQTDVWTFSRRVGTDDPNWLLSATGE